MADLVWQVQLLCEQEYGEFLVENFDAGNVRVRPSDREPGYVLEADSFREFVDAESVRSAAQGLALLLVGLISLERGRPRKLEIGAIHKLDAGRRVHTSLSFTESISVGVALTGISLGPPGAEMIGVIQPARSAIKSRLALAELDTNVRKVVRLLAKSAGNWVDLYRIYEVVEDDVGGQHSLQGLSWITPADVRRFKHSANSVVVGGDEARHGKEGAHPPSDPMELYEASSFVRRLVELWLTWKAKSATRPVA